MPTHSTHAKKSRFTIYQILFLASAILLVTSCKEKEVKISLADQIAGKYVAKSINIGGTLIPMPLISGKSILDIKFEVTKVLDDEVKMIVELKETVDSKDKISNETYNKLILKENPEGSISLMADGKELAKITKQNIKAKYDFNGIATTIDGERK